MIRKSNIDMIYELTQDWADGDALPKVQFSLKIMVYPNILALNTDTTTDIEIRIIILAKNKVNILLS